MDMEQDSDQSEEKAAEKLDEPVKLSTRVKTSLKLYKYSEYGKPVSMKDYGLPESFGKQKPQEPPKPKKTVEQVSL